MALSQRVEAKAFQTQEEAEVVIMASKTPKKNPAEKFVDLIREGSIEVPEEGFSMRRVRDMGLTPDLCLWPYMSPDGD